MRLARLLPILGWMLLPYAVIPAGLYGFQDYRATMLLYGLLCCLPPVLLYQRRERLRFWPLNIHPLLLLCLSAVCALSLWWLWRQVTPWMLDWPHLSDRLNAIALPPQPRFHFTILYFVLVNPLLEEAFWRGVIYRRLKDVFSQPQALVISAIFFGAWHWSILQHVCTPLWAVGLTIPVMIGGVLFGLMYEKTGTLAAPIVLHGLGADLPLIVILLEAMARL